MELLKFSLSNKTLPWISILYLPQLTPWLILINAVILFIIWQIMIIRHY